MPKDIKIYAFPRSYPETYFTPSVITSDFVMHVLPMRGKQ